MLSAIIFDFDGVILESAEIKTRAFAKLFEGFPDQVRSIVAHHRENAGVSRYEKFRYIYEHFLKMPLSESTIEKLDQSFSQIVYDEIRRCPLVPGVIAFLKNRSKELPLFIA